MARLLTQRFTLVCLLGLGLLSVGMIQGCVGEVDLQVLRADMETLKYEYRQHDQNIDRQLDTLESRISQPIQELSQTAVTLTELRDETRRLQLSLEALQREIDGTAFAQDMETAFASIETRLTGIERHPVVANQPDRKPPQTKPATTPPPTKPRPPVESPVDKQDGQEPATPPPPPVQNVAKNMSPQPPDSAQIKPEVVAPATQIAKTVPPDSPQPPPTTRSDDTAPPKPDQQPPDAQQNLPDLPQPPAPKTAAPFDSDVQLYEQALRMYQAENYDDALVLLERFRDQYTESPLAGNVQYWIGESLYAQRRYEAAIAAFDDVVQNYPEDTKVPAAILNQGLAFVKLRNVSRARFFLQQVQEKYADTSEADEATETLKQLQP